MRLDLVIDGQPVEAEFSFAEGKAQLRCHGRLEDAQVSEPEPGMYVVILKDRVFRCELERSSSGQTTVIINGRRMSVTVRDKRHSRGPAGGGAGASGKVNLIAPMPGKVVRVLLSPGDQVEPSQGVLVVEAMKMQNEVQSPKQGRVAEIRAGEGQTVNAGDILAVIE